MSWSRLARHARPHAWPAAVGLGLGLLALGPALGRGFVLSYDLVFVPDPPISTADLGFTGGPARAVPSDLVVALAARVVPEEFVEKIILILIFVLACSGAAALLAAGWPERLGDGRLALLARCVAGVFYAWNPFVAERLIMGQWALLLGYAGLPWVARELAGNGRQLNTSQLSAGRLMLATVPAAIGGFAAMSITALAAVPLAIGGGASWPDRARRTAVTLAIIVVASLPWVIPSFLVPVHADPNGANAFAARADTPFGTIGSLLMLGGIWNAQAVPAGYGSGPVSAAWLAVVLAAVAGYVLVARSRCLRGLGVAAIAGFGLAALGSWAPTLAALRAAITFWPAFALLRDGQQFIAPLALAQAVGLGAGVATLLARASTTRLARASTTPQAPASTTPQAPASTTRAGRQDRAAGPAVTLSVLALLAPLVLLPGLAWGEIGRLRAVQYPADWLTARDLLEANKQPGSVLLLPWAQYRRYPWNHGEPVFDPWPRLLARPMIWNDALTVGTTTVAPESQQALRLGPVITSGRPLTATLLAAGVRYVVVDAGPMLGRPRARLANLARLPGARVLIASPDLIVFRLIAGKLPFGISLVRRCYIHYACAQVSHDRLAMIG